MKHDIFAKGIYSHPQISGFISAKQYMIISRDDGKYLTVRFSNDGGFTLTGICMTVYQLDARGNVLRKNTLEQSGMQVLPGATFSPRSIIEADAKCSDVKVQITYADAGEYRYLPRRNRVTVTYMPPKERPIYEDICKRHGESRSVGRKFFPWVVAVLAAVVIINLVQIMLPFFKDSTRGAGGDSSAVITDIYDGYGRENI